MSVTKSYESMREDFMANVRARASADRSSDRGRQPRARRAAPRSSTTRGAKSVSFERSSRPPTHAGAPADTRQTHEDPDHRRRRLHRLAPRAQRCSRAAGWPAQPIERIVLADQVAPRAELTSDPRVEARVGALAEQCEALGREGFDGVFHLASAVSGECEADFDLGLRSNLDTTRALLDALRAATQRGARRRGSSSRARSRCSGPTRRCRCRRSSATTRCLRRRPRTARRSSSASSWSPTTRARASSTAARRA